MLQHRILEDIFGDKGLINEESLEDYDERLVSLIEKWNEIEKYHTKNDPLGKFAACFMKFKAELLRSKVAKPIRDRAAYKGDYTQNSKNEIDAGSKNYHKFITSHEAISHLKDRFLRQNRDAVKALYGEGKYKLSSDYSPFLNLIGNGWLRTTNFKRWKFLDTFQMNPRLAKKYIANDVTENIYHPQPRNISQTMSLKIFRNLRMSSKPLIHQSRNNP